MMRPNAIDVSAYQSADAIDYGALKAAGVELVIVKATEGRTGRDPQFAEHVEWATVAGLDVAFYHFLRAQSADVGRQEAAAFLARAAEFLDYFPTSFVVNDFEADSTIHGALGFHAAIHEAGYGARLAWYTYQSRANPYRELLPEPLWLAYPDDSPDAAHAIRAAHALAAFAVQYGQAPLLGGFDILCDLITDREQLNQLQRKAIDNMPLSPDDVQLLLDSPLGELLGDDGATMIVAAGGRLWTVREALVFTHKEAKSVRLSLGLIASQLSALAGMIGQAHDAANGANASAQRAEQHAERGADNAASAAISAARAVTQLEALGGTGGTPNVEQLATALSSLVSRIRLTILPTGGQS